ncbi:RraA family protein [Rugosimonospora acidiphila]|uniref:RraA family protein n=1 Tax=Rugosimonospora acidiphila TaxID=556531 RepID=UPI0031EA6593
MTSGARREVVAGVSVEEVAALGSATLHEAGGRIGALPAAIRPMTPSPSFAGPAVTVLGPPADNLWLHRAVYRCEPGDVLLANFGGAYEWGYWGEVLSRAAAERRIAAVVIDGCVRDLVRLGEVGLPVFARGSAIRGTVKHFDGVGAINGDLVVGEIVVRPGDWVVGDEDGVVVIPRDLMATVVTQAQQRVEKEARFMQELRDGKRTLDLYGFPA